MGKNYFIMAFCNEMRYNTITYGMMLRIQGG